MELWRVKVAMGATGAMQRLGVLVPKAASAEPLPEGGGWPKDLARHLKVDRLVVLVEAADGVQVRPLGKDADPDAKSDVVATLAARIWKQAGRVALAGAKHVKVDGKRRPVSGRSPIAKARPVAVLTPEALADTVAEKNRSTWPLVVQSLKSTMGVIPFVGAGLSAPFGFPQWGSLLEKLSPSSRRNEIARLVGEGKYEEAAQKLWDEGKASDRLQADIGQIFGAIPKAAEFSGKAVGVLPHLTVGPVITTNYDHILETAFELAGRPFTETVLGSEPDALVPAIQRNERVLFKIHGDCKTRRGLTLTLSSYDFAYGKAGQETGEKTREKLEGMLPILITNRPLLFLGCSMETDRTLQAVAESFERHARIAHYAILAADYDLAAFEAREDRLSKIGVRVLWYAPGRFEQIEVLLRGLLDAVAVEDLGLGTTPITIAAPVAPPPSPPAAAAAAPTATLPSSLRAKIRDGDVIYFLGAAASGDLLGDPFYDALASRYNAPVFDRTRADVAQFLVDKDARDIKDTRDALVDDILEVLQKHFPAPSATHRRFAVLAAGDASSAGTRLMLMTTNYDRGLETAFEQAGRPHHLFVYQPHGPYAGRLIHRTPQGTLRAVAAPEKMLDTGDLHPVIVKMNGGPRLHPDLPHAFAVATRDFYNLAARVPRVFPAFLQRELAHRSLLFLGHGLKEPDVEEVIRFRQRHGGPSWALKWSKDPSVTGPRAGARAYWGQIGVELLWSEIGPFMRAIEDARPA